MTAHDVTRARFVALMIEAPDAVPGSLPAAANARDERPTVHHEDYEESPDERFRANFIAAANDAPGALVGSLACICPPDRERQLTDYQEDCGKHGDYLRRYLYLSGLQRQKLTDSFGSLRSKSAWLGSHR